MNKCFSIVLLWLLSPQLAAATDVVLRSLPGRSEADAVAEIKRHLMLAPRTDDKVIFSKSCKLDSSLENVRLYKFSEKARNGTIKGSVEIICKKCYIKGDASATMTSKGDFNVTSAAAGIQASANKTLHEIADYASTVGESMENYVFKMAQNLTHDITDLDGLGDLAGFSLPPPDIDFNVDVGRLDEVTLQVAFKDTEIYAELAILLSAGVTYTLNLYTSKELGYAVGRVFVGFVASIDLIITADAHIELDTGFHIKFDNDVAMKLALFAEEPSHLSFNGGKFEFLPVTVATAGAVLRATLRIGVKTGFSMGVAFTTAVRQLNQTLHLQLGAGIEASAYANAAELVTNITVADISESVKDHKCDFLLEQGYQLAIGAAAGASVDLMGHAWGPVPRTEVPIFYTVLSTGCAATRTPAAALPSVALQIAAARDGLATTTATTATEVTYVALQCLSTGVTNCPASLQSRVTNVVSTTLTATVKSGESPVWTAANGAQSTAVEAVAFGSGAITMTASSGNPVSYTSPLPPASTISSSSNGEDGIHASTGGVSNKDSVIIGVCVGLGVPLLASALVFAIIRRRKRGSKSGYGSLPILMEDVAYAEPKGRYRPYAADESRGAVEAI